MKQPLLLERKGNSLDDGPGIRSVIFVKGCTDHLPAIPDIGNHLFGGSSSDQAIPLFGSDSGEAVDHLYAYAKAYCDLGGMQMELIERAEYGL